ncbi:hypothetical protein ILUMI_14053 [Ignelater luminosus]|uniref:Uncharacterized protein n=1 Tax=Ignelater luminosus TaxID=2038154 RepID=A0A8K0CZG9_IGNLU|nr:hypothetical protein ILUMI_14053 [Ignelater luminosus]
MLEEWWRKCLQGLRVEFRWINPHNDSDVLRIVCTDMQPGHYSCFNIILEKVDHCMELEEKYLPNFMSEWFNHTFASHCEGEGEVFKEHEDVFDNADCNDVDANTMDNLSEKCLSRSTVLKVFQNIDFIITKAGLCGYLEHANVCLIDFLKEFCGKFLANYVEAHFKPTKIWCDKYVNDV